MPNKDLASLPITTQPVSVLALDADGITSTATTEQLVATQFDRLAIPDMVNAAQQSSLNAQDSATLAGQYASASEDTLITGGTFSALHYREKAADTARAAPLISEKIIDDTVSSPYTLVAADKFRCLVFTRSTALTVICPQNWANDPALDGSSSQAWVQVLRLGTGIITFTGQSTTTVVTPTITVKQAFVYNTTTEPPPAYVGNHSITVPAGTGRKFWAALFAIYGSNKAGRNSTLTASNTTSLSKVVSDTSTGNNAATSVSPLPVAVWSASMADSTTATTVAIAVTPDADPNSYVLYVGVVANGNTITGAVATSGTANATTVDRAVTTTVDKSMVLFGSSIQGGDASPTTLTGPTGFVQQFNGRTGSRGAKDSAYAMGSYLANTAGTSTFTLTSDQSDQGASFAIIVTPNTGTLVASTILTPDGATLASAGKMATIFARSDGASFIKAG